MGRKGCYLKVKDSYTVGIEEEYMICNSNNLELYNCAPDIIKRIPNRYKERFSYELLNSVIEINTKPNKSVSECIDEIADLRKILSNIGKELEFSIGFSGTHPTSLSEKQSFVQTENYKWVRDQLSYYASRNLTFGLHVHIAVDSLDVAVKLTNHLRRYIAPLLALSANSPFFEGIKTGMQSSRTFQFGVFPRTGIPDTYPSSSEYLEHIKKLMELKSINFDRQIWWKIRPHTSFNTIEFRMCDMQNSLLITKSLAALCQALVHSNYYKLKNNNLFVNFKKDYLDDALWKAARFGMEGVIYDEELNKTFKIRDFILEILNDIEDSLKYFGNENIIKTIHDILNNGNGADNQIKCFEKFGFEGLKKQLIEKDRK